MAVEALQQLARLDVPQGARGVTAAGQDLLVGVRERAARHVAGVRADGLFAQRHLLVSAHRIDGHFVVETAANAVEKPDVTLDWPGSHTLIVPIDSPASDQIAGWRVCTCHDPCGRHRDGMFALRQERVPDAQLAVLRRRNDVTLVRRPVAAQHLGGVPLQDAPRFDIDECDHLDALGGSGHWQEEQKTHKIGPTLNVNNKDGESFSTTHPNIEQHKSTTSTSQREFQSHLLLTRNVVQFLALLFQSHFQRFGLLLQCGQLIGSINAAATTTARRCHLGHCEASLTNAKC